MRRRSGLGEREGSLGQRALGDRRRCGRARVVKVLDKGAAEVDDGPCRIYGDACELGDILAAVCVGGEMRSSRMCDENERESRNLSRCTSLLAHHHISNNQMQQATPTSQSP